MKVGLILECGPEGADKKVCELVLRRIVTDIEIVTITLDNKPNLVERCGESALRLIIDGCERVVIVWDLHPPWRYSRPCRKEDRENIGQSLNNSGLHNTGVYLVCIEEELEAWLLADGRALSTVLSTAAHPVKIQHRKRPHQVKKPKAQIIQMFQQQAGIRYVDLIHAERIIRSLPDFSQLRRCETFARFVSKATGIAL
ncbi:MAG: hypothetical protein KF868_06245 [Acidobacteria bacterium]|nr:hypothetical protein [Acidobacteriota bacterium]